MLKNIQIELNQLPETYLRHWYELIHTFREKLSSQEGDAGPSQKTDSDWDALVEEVMKNRQQYNRQSMGKMESNFRN